MFAAKCPVRTAANAVRSVSCITPAYPYETLGTDGLREN